MIEELMWHSVDGHEEMSQKHDGKLLLTNTYKYLMQAYSEEETIKIVLNNLNDFCCKNNTKESMFVRTIKDVNNVSLLGKTLESGLIIETKSDIVETKSI